MREYKKAVLVAAKTKTKEDEANFRKALLEMEKALFLKNYYKAFALVPGCCTNCDSCGANKGAKCKNPEHKRPCIEGTGIDVFALVRKYKKNIQTLDDKKKSFESYGLILLE
jgi:predicted metal-binding protein